MATQTVTQAGVTAQADQLQERLVAWVKGHRQASSWIATVLVVAAVLLIWTLASTRRSEAVASRQLQSARFSYDNQNMPLAASELSRIIENYSGTNAAAEARLLLGQVRLAQGQPQQTVELLRDFAPGAGAAYRAQAFGLLGAAYENLGKAKEAAEAYEAGAARARLDFLKAQMLSDAGRAWTAAGDTAKAVAAYRRIVNELPKSSSVTEAKVRLGELTKGAL
jgi:tetratricopeptide (TPR) repeat protein